MDFQETERPLAGAVVFVAYYYDGWDYGPIVGVYQSKQDVENFIANHDDPDGVTWEAFRIR